VNGSESGARVPRGQRPMASRIAKDLDEKVLCRSSRVGIKNIFPGPLSAGRIGLSSARVVHKKIIDKNN